MKNVLWFYMYDISDSFWGIFIPKKSMQGLQGLLLKYLDVLIICNELIEYSIFDLLLIMLFLFIVEYCYLFTCKCIICAL